MKTNREDLPLGENLKRCGITQISKEGEQVLLVLADKVVLFRINQGGIYSTLENFRKNSKGIMDVKTQQAIIILLSREEYAGFFCLGGKQKKDATPTEQNDNSIGVGYTQNQKNLCQELNTLLPDGDYVEYVIKTAKRTVKGEDSLVRLLVYVGLTKRHSCNINDYDIGFDNVDLLERHIVQRHAGWTAYPGLPDLEK